MTSNTKGGVLIPCLFCRAEFKYEVIPGVQKQFDIVKGLLNRPDVETIYVCTDSGREGEYIYRLVASDGRREGQETRKRVWIDSQTEEEILRGIREAKDLSVRMTIWRASAYLRAKEDYLMGINFSRVLTLKLRQYSVSSYLKSKYQDSGFCRPRDDLCPWHGRPTGNGRSGTFVKTPFYRVIGTIRALAGDDLRWGMEELWRAASYFQSPLSYTRKMDSKKRNTRRTADRGTF